MSAWWLVECSATGGAPLTRTPAGRVRRWCRDVPSRAVPIRTEKKLILHTFEGLAKPESSLTEIPAAELRRLAAIRRPS